MYFKTPVPIPYETKKVTRTKATNGKVYIGYTISVKYDSSVKKSRSVRKAIGRMCQDDETMMYPNENYYKLFPDEHPAEDNDSALTEYMQTHDLHASAADRSKRTPKKNRVMTADEIMAVLNVQGEKNLERRKAGLPYWCNDPALFSEQHVYQDKMVEYNRTMPTETDLRQNLLKEMFAEIGEDCMVEAPINANWGCHNVHLGSGVYINSNVTFVDDADIYIGDNCLIAPNVVFATAGHPILPELRENDYQYELPIHIGRNVWIGSAVQIMPGITIGDNSVIGAGSVVTRDIPAGVVAYGVPCKERRKIGQRDREFYYRDRRFPKE